MESTKQIIIKNRKYYFFSDVIRINDFNLDLLKIDQKSYKNINIYCIEYITIKDNDYVNIYSINLLYFIIDKADGYIEESNGYIDI